MDLGHPDALTGLRSPPMGEHNEAVYWERLRLRKARDIPVRTLLGEELSQAEFDQAFPRLHQYVDLTNEQIFLRMKGRISRATWLEWRDGTESNLGRAAFGQAWARVKKGAAGSFTGLRRLEASRFSEDPRSWVPVWRKLW